MMQVNRGDKFILHSENGKDYEIRVVNVNEYREPSMTCGCDVFLDGVSVNEDIWFCGEDFLLSEKCEKIQEG